MFLRVIDRIEEAIIAFLLVTFTGLMVLEVVMRYIFKSGFLWNQELTLNLSAWFVLFGVSYGLKKGSHICVDAFVRLFPQGGQRVLTVIASLLSLIYCGLVLYGGWVYLGKMKRVGTYLHDLPVPVWVSFSIMIPAFVFLTIRIILLLVNVIRGKEDVFRHADEAQDSMEIVEELKSEEGRI